MTKRSIGFSITSLVALALMIGACAPASPGPGEALSPTLDDATQALATSPADPTEGAPAGAAVPTETKPVRTDQYATDPSTVELAAGRPTLVKFFAFW